MKARSFRGGKRSAPPPRMPLGKRRRLTFFLLYHLCFGLLLFVIFLYYYLNGRSFIWYPDGTGQYSVIVGYTRNYLVKVIKTLLSGGGLVLPQWDFSIGQGTNVFQVLHLNPLFLFAMLLPARYLEYSYGFICLFQVYLSGLAFSFYCFSIHRKDPIAVVIGAMGYVFSGFGMYNLGSHIFFISYMLLCLPILLAGCERWLQKRKWGTFVLIVFLMLINNYYSAYMNSLLMATYLVIRELYVNRTNFKKSIVEIAQLFGLYLWGLGLSLFNLLPMVINYLSCSRSGGTSKLSLFYNESFYRALLVNFFKAGKGGGVWTRLGFTGLAGMALLLLFLRWRRKKLVPLRVGMVVLTAYLCLPIVGKIFNGFGYMANRWSYGFAFGMALVLTYMVPYLARLRRRDMVLLCVGTVAYIGLVKYLKPKDGEITFALALVAFSLVFVILIQFLLNTPRLRKRAMAVLMTALLLVNFHLYLDPNYQNFVGKNELWGEFYGTIKNSGERRSELVEDPGLYRIETRNNRKNKFCLTGGYGSSAYWSVLDSTMVDYYQDFNISSLRELYAIWGLDQRTTLCALAGVKYFSGKNIREAPYGFEQVMTHGLTVICRNRYALPFGYTYDGVLRESDYDKLSPLEKQQAILQGAVVRDEVYDQLTQKLEATQPRITAQTVDYTVVDTDGVTIEGDTYTTDKKNASFTISFDGLPDSETYLYLKGFTAEKGMTGERSLITVSDRDKENELYKRTDLYTTGSLYYFPREGVTFNLGYSEEGKNIFQVSFTTKGTYHIDQMQVVCLPMADYVTDVEKLGETTLENVEEGANTVSGTLSLSQTKLLAMPIPYTKWDGWRLYVNGEETDLLQVNGMYHGVVLEPGEYEIEMRYTAPGLVPGGIVTLISAAGVVIVLLYSLLQRLRGKRKDSAGGDEPV